MVQWVKNQPVTQETEDVGQEDPLEEKMATRSSILAWRIPWTEDPGGLQSMGHKEHIAQNLPISPNRSVWGL